MLDLGRRSREATDISGACCCGNPFSPVATSYYLQVFPRPTVAHERAQFNTQLELVELSLIFHTFVNYCVQSSKCLPQNQAPFMDRILRGAMITNVLEPSKKILRDERNIDLDHLLWWAR